MATVLYCLECGAEDPPCAPLCPAREHDHLRTMVADDEVQEIARLTNERDDLQKRLDVQQPIVAAAFKFDEEMYRTGLGPETLRRLEILHLAISVARGKKEGG